MHGDTVKHDTNTCPYAALGMDRRVVCHFWYVQYVASQADFGKIIDLAAPAPGGAKRKEKDEKVQCWYNVRALQKGIFTPLLYTTLFGGGGPQATST